MNTHTCLGGPYHGLEISAPGSAFRAPGPLPVAWVWHDAMPPVRAQTFDILEYRLTDGFWMIDPSHWLATNRVAWAVDQHAKHHERGHALEMGRLDFQDACIAGGPELEYRHAGRMFFCGLPVIVREEFRYHLKLI